VSARHSDRCVGRGGAARGARASRSWWLAMPWLKLKLELERVVGRSGTGLLEASWA
jgi:hypothetical protein